MLIWIVDGSSFERIWYNDFFSKEMFDNIYNKCFLIDKAESNRWNDSSHIVVIDWLIQTRGYFFVTHGYIIDK